MFFWDTVYMALHRLVVRLSGNSNACINKVTLCQAQLLLTRAIKPFWHVTSHSGQLSLLPLAGWKVLAGKVAVCLASHFPCITDSVVYIAISWVAYYREMTSLPMLFYGVCHFSPFTVPVSTDGSKHNTKCSSHMPNKSSCSNTMLSLGYTSCYVCGSVHTERDPTECQSWVPSDDHWMPRGTASHVSSSSHHLPSLPASWWQNEGWRYGKEERSPEAGDFLDPNHRHKAMQ